MNKSEVCVKLTRKNCKKVLEILEMFGESVYAPNILQWNKRELFRKDDCVVLDTDGEWTGSCIKDELDKAIVKPRELRNTLAKEHLKAGDVVVYKVSHNWCGIVDRIEVDRIYFSKVVCLSDNTIYEDVFETLSELNSLRYATDKEKALLELKTTIVTLNPVDTFTGSILGQATYTREVWVNHYSNGKFDVYENKDIASFTSGITGKTVKATLTYDIPMTKV